MVSLKKQNIRPVPIAPENILTIFSHGYYGPLSEKKNIKNIILIYLFY